MCQMSQFLLRPCTSSKFIGGFFPLKSDLMILKVKIPLYTFGRCKVLTGTETSDTSRRSFLGQNNNIEMGYPLNKTKGLKLHRVIHLSTHVYLSTKVTYLSYHSLHLLLYHIFLSAKVTYLSYHSLHQLLYHIYLSTKVIYLSYHSLHLIYHIPYTLIYLNIL